MARVAVREQRRGGGEMLVFERLDFDPGHRGGTIDQARRSQTEVWHRISVCPSVCSAYIRYAEARLKSGTGFRSARAYAPHTLGLDAKNADRRGAAARRRARPRFRALPR